LSPEHIICGASSRMRSAAARAHQYLFRYR
jgi:hypothetical protein